MYREQYLHSNNNIEKAEILKQKEFHKNILRKVKAPMSSLFSDYSQKRYNSQSKIIRTSAKKELI